MAAAAEGPLSVTVLRGLSDRVYEKRKAAALEIEAKIKESLQSPLGGSQDVQAILNLLGRDYALSTQSTFRKGGLIGLAAATLGLGSEAHKWLNHLLPPVLSCFTDQDSRVRYYACEALYNVAKVTRNNILDNFNEIFEGLCRLCSDTDQGVKNGAQLLDRLMKDIVADAPSFPLEPFLPVLREHLRKTNTYVRHFLLGWVTTLHAIEHIKLHQHLPHILEGIFSILADNHQEIKLQADTALAHLLRSLQEGPESVDYAHITPVLVRCAERLTPNASAEKASNSSTSNSTNPTTPNDSFGQGGEEMQGDGGMVGRVAYMWILEFVRMGGKQVIPFTGDIVQLVFLGSGSDREDVRKTADEVDFEMRRLVSESVRQAQQEGEPDASGIDLLQVLAPVMDCFNVPTSTAVRLRGLSWLELVVGITDVKKHRQLTPTFLPSLMNTLQDEETEVIRRALRVVAQVSAKSNGEGLQGIIRQMLSLFLTNRVLVRDRSGIIIKELCLLLDPEIVYLEIGKALEDMEDTEVAASLTERLTMILLTVPEFASLRRKLLPADDTAHASAQQLVDDSPSDAASASTPAAADGGGSGAGAVAAKDGPGLFLALYRAWQRYPVSALSLCLLAGEYEKSNELVKTVAVHMRDKPGDWTLQMLLELDKLVQLLESPVFAPLRMRLLCPAEHPHLVKTLYGVLMLLPQSEAFEVLRRRLKSVPTLALLSLSTPPARSAPQLTA